MSISLTLPDTFDVVDAFVALILPLVSGTVSKLGGGLDNELWWRSLSSEVRQPLSKEHFESIVEDGATNLQQEVGTLCRPAHLLAFPHPLIDQVIHRRFSQSAGYLEPFPPVLSIVS